MHDDDEDLWADDDDEVEGLFHSKNSIFDDGPPVDTDNRLVSQTEDVREHSPPVNAGGLMKKKKQPVALVAVFDQNGEPVVARHKMVNGKPMPVEEFRRPTADEYNSIMFNGKIVRGGVVAENVPTGTNVQATLQRSPLGQTEEPAWKKVAKWGVGLGALGGAGYLGWRWWKNREEV